MQTSKTKPHRSYSLRLLKALVSITLILLTTHVLMQYLNWEVFYQQNGQVYELANRFDLDDEVSVPTWFSQILFLTIGLGAFLAAHFQASKKSRNLWRTIGAIGLIFSIDEISGLHEFVLQTLHVIFFEDAGPTELDNAWLIVLPFILAVGIWLAWRMYRVIPKRTILIFVTAGVIFLIGAVGVDLLTSITERESFLNQGILTGIEEALELLASVTVVYALADYLERHHDEKLKHIVNSVRNSRTLKK